MLLQGDSPARFPPTVPYALGRLAQTCSWTQPSGKKLASGSPPLRPSFGWKKADYWEALDHLMYCWGHGAKGVLSGPPGSGPSPAQPHCCGLAVSCMSQSLMGKQCREMDQEPHGPFFLLAGLPRPLKGGLLSLPPGPLHFSFPRNASEVKECLSHEKPWRKA